MACFSPLLVYLHFTKSGACIVLLLLLLRILAKKLKEKLERPDYLLLCRPR